MKNEEIKKLLEMSEEELFALIGTRLLLLFDDSKYNSNNYVHKRATDDDRRKRKAERILGETLTEKEWQDIYAIYRKTSRVQALLDNGIISEEDLMENQLVTMQVAGVETIKKYIKISFGYKN